MRNRFHFLKLGVIHDLIPRPLLLRLRVLFGFRLFANALDIFALALVSVLVGVAQGYVESEKNDFEISIGDLILGVSDQLLIAIGVVILLLFIFKSFLSVYLRLRTARVVADVEVFFTEKLISQSFAENSFEMQKDEKAKMQDRLLSSTQGMGLMINSRYSAISELVLLLALLGIFFVLNPLLTVTAIFFISSVLLLLGKFLKSRVQRNTRKVWEGTQDTLQGIDDYLGVLREIRLKGTESHWKHQILESRARVATGTSSNYALMSLPRYIIESSLILGVFLFLMVAISSSSIEQEADTLAVFFAGGLRLVALLIPFQAALSQLTEGKERAEPAIKTLKQLTHSPELIQDSESNGPMVTDSIPVEFCKVGVTRDEKSLISGVSLKITAGSNFAIVGPSGSGKTTLLNLAAGIIQPDSGTVSLGGVTPREFLSLSPGSIGLVPQSPRLVKGSLAENISLESEDKTDLDKVQKSLVMANLEKYSTARAISQRVAPESNRFSGGEIQRLGLARALYGQPKLLLLDEFTSALDSSTESLVIEAISGLRGRVTTIIIAHRLSSIAGADEIAYLDEGVLMGVGTFEELRKRLPQFNEEIRKLSMGDSAHP